MSTMLKGLAARVPEEPATQRVVGPAGEEHQDREV